MTRLVRVTACLDQAVNSLDIAIKEAGSPTTVPLYLKRMLKAQRQCNAARREITEDRQRQPRGATKPAGGKS